MKPRQQQAKLDECPYCTEVLAPDLLHICPAGCCYVEGYEGEERVICPYCELPFEVSAGHVCLELIALTEPVQ
jgi:hypothetical protein